MSKIFLYHQVPKDLRGDFLYPLNTLKDIYPDLYEPMIKKYEDREYILERLFRPSTVFGIVFSFTAVHPEEISKAFAEIGQSFAGRHYFQIDASLLEPENTTIYLYQHRRKEDDLNAENFEPYTLENVSKYMTIPDETKEYFKEKFDKGEKPLLYHRIPHILYKGNLNIQNMPVIETF